MSIGNRILSIMEKKGYSKNYLAKQIGIHPSTLNNWITGNTSPDNLKLDVLCGFLDINLQWLQYGTGDIFRTQASAEPLTNPTITMIPLVSQYAHAGYLNGYGDMDYVDTLPKYPVYLDHEPTLDLYMAFEVKGDSMENGTEDSLIEGDILVCRSIDKEYWKSKLHYSKWDFVIVHKTDGIIVKRIINHDVENGVITIHSLNTFYPDKQIHLNDVTKLFSVVKTIRSRRR